MRATIDTELRAAPHARFFEGARYASPFLGERAVLEVKTGGAPPDWLGILARRHRLTPCSVSKFALACSESYAFRR